MGRLHWENSACWFQKVCTWSSSWLLGVKAKARKTELVLFPVFSYTSYLNMSVASSVFSWWQNETVCRWPNWDKSKPMRSGVRTQLPWQWCSCLIHWEVIQPRKAILQGWKTYQMDSRIFRLVQHSKIWLIYLTHVPASLKLYHG